MRLGASIVGDLRQGAGRGSAGWRARRHDRHPCRTDQVKADLRRQVTTAFPGNARGIANAWRSMIFPRSGQSLRPAGLVFTKVPNVIDAFERGALIRAKGGGKFLAIPTGFNAARGRRGSRGKGMRVTPAQMVASARLSLRPFKSDRASCGACRCARASRLGGVAGPGSWRAASPMSAPPNARAARPGARLLEQGMGPMFLLLPQVKLRQTARRTRRG